MGLDRQSPSELPGEREAAEPLGDPRIAELLPLIGDRVFLLNPRRGDGQPEGGGDFDLAVERLDPLWPLRLPPGWRICQVLQYDVRGWYWVLDHDGETVALDTIDDPKGYGRDGVPTDRLIRLAETSPDAARAAYLTAKRVRKTLQDSAEWKRIAAAAGADPGAYRHALSWMFGERLARALHIAAEEGIVPEDHLLRRARLIQWIRRRSTPIRLAASFTRSAARIYQRSANPSGLYIVVAGPDGTGKSSLADALPELCSGPFRRYAHFHWRPGVLPFAGALVGSERSDPSRPHARPPHGPLGSVASLVYHWSDFFLGGWLRFVPTRARSGLVVLERGWWDIGVDPRRYRIRVPEWLPRALGHLLPRPDLVLVLEAPAEVLLARKAEIDQEELVRQTNAWGQVLPRRIRRVYVDASRPFEQVKTTARREVFQLLGERAARSIGPGWLALPRRNSPRWMLPRGPRRSARAALSIYQPVTVRGRLGWEVGRALAASGLLRLSPRGQGPPESVRAALAPYAPPRSTLGVLRANHPARFLALVLGVDGHPHAIAKVSSDEAGIAALESEARNIESYGRLLEPPLRAPKVLARSPGLLLLEAVSWIPRARPWVLPAEVAHSLGRAYARSAGNGSGHGIAHGDCAPWNLLRTPDGWVLVDWEEARTDAPPFYDLFHYVVQAHVLLGRPTFRPLTSDEPGPSWVRTAVASYAAAVGRSPSGARRHLVEYLRLSAQRLDPSDPEQARALSAREGLLDALGQM